MRIYLSVGAYIVNSCSCSCATESMKQRVSTPWRANFYPKLTRASSGDYCPHIYHNICLDQEEMALDSDGFWYCPDCKANHFSGVPCQPVSENAASLDGM